MNATLASLSQQVQSLSTQLEKYKKNERILDRMNRRWQAAFDIIADAVAILDADQRIIRCNLAMQSLIGRPLGKIVGHACWQLVHGTDQPPKQCPYAAVRTSHKQATFRLAMGHRWFDITVDPCLDDQDRIAGYIHIMRDVTQVVQNAHDPTDAHQTLLAVLDSVDAFIYVAAIESHEILFLNHRLRDKLKGDLILQPCWRAIYRRNGPCEHCKRHPVLDDQGNPTHPQVWETMNDARNRWLLHLDRAIRWKDGRYVRLHVATDVSAVKMLEQERRQNTTRFRQAQKMEAIGTLAGGIAHDFNNILTVILGFSELAMQDAKRGKASPAFMNRIVEAGNRAQDLVQQILTFSRQGETEVKPIGIQSILKEALKLLRASLPSTIEIVSVINSEALILADPIQIHQVIMNLCTNASQAMEAEGGVLKIVLEDMHLDRPSSEPNPQLQPGAYQVLHVSDTGKGIDPEIIDRVFDPYFTTKKPGQGTGMGLSVVQGIVHGCGGAVAVNSAPGRGATFQIYLPIQQQHPRSRKATDDIRIFGHERILFVDDEPALTELGKELLQRMGYRVTTHTDSIQALTLFARHPENFDLVITDMTMPHMTGDVFAEKVIAIRPDIPIIICTGYSQKVNPEMIDRLGIRALILKPLVRNELGATIRRVMDGPRPHLKLV